MDSQQVPRVQASSSVEFVFVELLKLSAVLDFSDEVGRKNFLDLLPVLLKNFQRPEQNVAQCMTAYKCIYEDKFEEYSKVVVDLIAQTLGECGEDGIDEQLSKLQFERERKLTLRSKLCAGMDAAVSRRTPTQQRDDLAAQLKRLDEDLAQSYGLVWLRILHIVIEFLHQVPPDAGAVVPDVLGRVILATISQHENIDVYKAGIEALGSLCLLKLEIIPTHLPLILTALQHPNQSIVEMALKIVFDVLFIWGEGAIEKQMERTAQQGPAIASPSPKLGIPCSPSTPSTPPTLSATLSATPVRGLGIMATPNFLVQLRLILLQFLVYGRCHEWAEYLDPWTEVTFETSDMVDTTQDHLKAVAAEGFAKLLSRPKRWSFESNKLLAQLLLNYCRPTTRPEDGDEDDDDEEESGFIDEKGLSFIGGLDEMCQVLQPFFSAWSFSSHARQQMMVEAGALAVRHVVNANFCCVLPLELQPVERAGEAAAMQRMIPTQFRRFLACLLYWTDCERRLQKPDPEATLDRTKVEKESCHEQLCILLLKEILASPEHSRTIAQAFPNLKLLKAEDGGLIGIPTPCAFCDLCPYPYPLHHPYERLHPYSGKEWGREVGVGGGGVVTYFR